MKDYSKHNLLRQGKEGKVFWQIRTNGSLKMIWDDCINITIISKYSRTSILAVNQPLLLLFIENPQMNGFVGK